MKKPTARPFPASKPSATLQTKTETCPPEKPEDLVKYQQRLDRKLATVVLKKVK